MLYARIQLEPLEDRTLLDGTDLMSLFTMTTSMPDGNNELFVATTLPLSGRDESSLPGNGGFAEVGTAEFEITPGRIKLATEIELAPSDTTTERDNAEVTLNGNYTDEYEIIVPADRSLDGRTATMDVTLRISGSISLGHNDALAYTTARLDVRAPFTSDVGYIVRDGIKILNGEEISEGTPDYPKEITANVQFVLGQRNAVSFVISTDVGTSLEIGAPAEQYGAATDFTLQWLRASNLQVVDGPALAISDVLIDSASGFNYLTGGADDELPEPDEEFHWTDAAGGSFGDADNWEAAVVPGNNATVFFDLPATYTVDVGSHAVERAMIGGSSAVDVTFSNTNLLVQSTSETQPGVAVDNGSFTLADGTMTSNHAVIGPQAATEGFILGGARWFNNGGFAVGAGGEAILTIGNGTLTSGETRIGDAISGGEGAISVQGPNSRLNAGTLGVGMHGRGTLTVEQGASASAEHVVLADSPTGSGQISIIGSHPLTGVASRFDVTGGLIIGDGGTIDAPQSGGEGEFIVIGGAVVDVGEIVLIGNTGTGQLAVSGVHADSGLPSVFSSDLMFIGFVSEGSMTVSNGASVLTSGRTLVGNKGKVTVQDDGSSWLLQEDLDLEEEGLLEVQQGGLVSAPNLSSDHIVDVKGQGSERASTLRVANLLSIGGQGGTPILNVDDGAVVEAGAISLGADPGAPVGVLIGGIGANGQPATLRETATDVQASVFDVVVGNQSPTSVFVVEGGLFEAAGQIVIGVGENGGVAVEGLDGPTGFRSTLRADSIYLGLGPVESGLGVRGGALAIARSAVIDSTGTAQIVGGQNGVLSRWSLDEELEFAGGTLTVADNGTVTIGLASPQANRVVVGPGGTLSGSGTINLDPLPGNAAVVNAGGVIDVGNSPGTISIMGDLVLDDGDLEIEIAGAAPGSEFDQLIVTGNVQLGGTLKLVFLDGFVPQPGQTFEFLDATSVVGAFQNLVIEGLPAGLDVSFDSLSGDLSIEEVEGVNFGPILDPIANRSTEAGQTVTFTAAATDPDGDNLTFSLDAGAPVGAAINSQTGAFSWTPTIAHANQTFSLTVRVTDDGNPALSDTQTFQVTVLPLIQPQFTMSAINGPNVGVPGQLRSYFVTFNEPGVGDTYTATIDWGDGSIDSGFVATSESGGNTAGIVSFWHTYTTIGDHTIELALRDSQSNELATQTDITVQLITFQPDPLDNARRALVVGGFEGVNDQITFVPTSNGANVLYNGFENAGFVFDGSLLAFGQSGDDTITVNPSITRAAMLFGQAGNDLLFGGRGSNILIGGTGADMLFGEGVRDLLFGGLGGDTLQGNGGDDLLASDFTIHEYDPALLALLFHRWTSADSYADRLHNLRYDQAPALNNTTIFDDFELDLLTGGEAFDWFLFLSTDQVSDSEATEEGLGTAL